MITFEFLTRRIYFGTVFDRERQRRQDLTYSIGLASSGGSSLPKLGVQCSKTVGLLSPVHNGESPSGETATICPKRWQSPFSATVSD